MKDSDIVSTLLLNNIPKFFKIKNENMQWVNLNEEIIEEEDYDKYTEIEKYENFLNEINTNFKQDDINQLKNEFDVILYFYINEIICLDYIRQNFKDNKNERILYKKFSNTLLRLLFENNESIKEIAQNINQKLSDINKNYDNFDFNMDLSEETYLKKIQDAFNTDELPHFLLVRGYRLLKSLRKEKENYEKQLKMSNNDDSFKITENQPTPSFNGEKDDINFLDIINKFYSKESTPFMGNYDISLNENLLLLFLMFYLKYKNDDINNLDKTIISKLIHFFIFDNENDKNVIENLKKQDKAILINILIDSFFNEQYNNNIQLSIKFIMASYCYMIFEIGFENPNKLFEELILSLENDFISIYDIKICLKEFQEKIKNDDDYYIYFKKDKTTTSTTIPTTTSTTIPETISAKTPTITPIINPKELLDFNFKDIEEKMEESTGNVKEQFKKNILKEKKLESEQNDKRSKRKIMKLVNWLKRNYTMKSNKNELIETKLKLFPKSKEINGDLVTIFITGFYSSDSDLKGYWKNFTNEYLEKYPNSMIYYYNWPSNNLDVSEVLYNKEEFNFADDRAKMCGKILGNLIESNLFFGDFKINLVGFSLGCQIIKNCLEELYNRKVFNRINNVIFIAGATSSKFDNWDGIFETVKGNIFNCYSLLDVGLIVRLIYLYDYSIGRVKLNTEKREIININCSPCTHLIYRTKMKQIVDIFSGFLKKIKK